MVFAAILAGGSGKRMKRELPKQYLDIGDKPIIIHTLIKFLKAPGIDKIYIGVNENWIDYCGKLIKKYLDVPSKPIILVKGGKERYDTLFNLIDKVEEENGKNKEHIFVSHEAVRPFVTVDMIEKSIIAAKECGACNTVVGAKDTIILSKDGVNTDSMPSRDEIYLGQCPQSFNLSMLKELILNLSEEEKKTLTDACKIFILNNKPVKLIEGDASNFKITTKGDYDIAKAMADEYLEE